MKRITVTKTYLFHKSWSDHEAVVKALNKGDGPPAKEEFTSILIDEVEDDNSSAPAA